MMMRCGLEQVQQASTDSIAGLIGYLDFFSRHCIHLIRL
jgi:hypothetical protein